MRPQSTREADAWGTQAPPEPVWPAQLAILAAVAIYIALPRELTIGPAWLVPAFELALLFPLAIFGPRAHPADVRWLRPVAISLTALINVANIGSLVLLVRALLQHMSRASGEQLIVSSIGIWITNVIVFGLWFWELDRGGPRARARAHHAAPDFLFPQMVTPGCAPSGWSPKFMDYLYLAFTNATAFSPADTMPLTAWAKALMLTEALASLLTLAFVAARAVGILSS